MESNLSKDSDNQSSSNASNVNSKEEYRNSSHKVVKKATRKKYSISYYQIEYNCN